MTGAYCTPNPRHDNQVPSYLAIVGVPIFKHTYSQQVYVILQTIKSMKKPNILSIWNSNMGFAKKNCVGIHPKTFATRRCCRAFHMFCKRIPQRSRSFESPPFRESCLELDRSMSVYIYLKMYTDYTVYMCMYWWICLQIVKGSLGEKWPGYVKLQRAQSTHHLATEQVLLSVDER